MEKRGEQILQITAIALLAIGCLLVLRPFVTALLSGAIMCFATWPLYQQVLGWLGGRPNLASLLMTLLLVMVIVLPLAFIALTLADAVGPAVEWVRDMLAHGLPLPPEWVNNIPLVGSSVDAWWRDL